MEDLQQLIDRGPEIKSLNYDSPIVGMWENDIKAAVARFGETAMEVLEQAMHFGYVITDDDMRTVQMHHKRVDQVTTLLEDLKKRNAEDTQAQARIILQKKEEAKATLGAKFRGSTTFNGPVTFGPNSPANSVQVGELILAIIGEAEERLPEGADKSKILAGLRAVAANPTFAALAGASLPEILKHLLG